MSRSKSPRGLSPGTYDRVRQTLESFPTVSSLAEDTLNGKYSETHKPALFTRALVWKLMTLKLNKVNRQQGHDSVELNLSSLNKLRDDYDVLKTEYDVPWHELNPQSDYYEALREQDEGFDLADDLNKRQELSRMRVYHDPLSTESDTTDYNTIKNQESDVQLLEAIMADVDRLFPECPDFFIDHPQNRKEITQILYLWCKLNGVAYFQGLHELCGLIYMVFASELIDSRRHPNPDRLGQQIISLMDQKYLSHDTFNVFNILMRPVMDNYYSESALLQQSIMFDLKLHQADKFLYHLFKNKFRLDSRIWLMRYLRLVLIREIGLVQSMRLWDKLITYSFLVDPFKAEIDLTELIPSVVVIMLSSIKDRLIVADYGEALYMLLHYPTDTSTVPQLKDSIIFIQDDEQDTSTSDINFQYIEENHHRHSENLSPHHTDDEDEDEPELVHLNINKVVQDAIKLHGMTDKELEIDGAKLLESYSGLHNQQDKRGRISTARKSSTWHSSSKQVLDPSQLQPSPSPERKDFDRTRLEMRLKKKVSDTLNK